MIAEGFEHEIKELIAQSIADFAHQLTSLGSRPDMVEPNH